MRLRPTLEWARKSFRASGDIGFGGEYGRGQGLEGPYILTGRVDLCSYVIEEEIEVCGRSSNVATNDARLLVTRECLNIRSINEDLEC